MQVAVLTHGGARQVTGMKVYHTKDDDAIMEANLEWGSEMKVRVGVRLKLGPIVIYFPLEVEDIQVWTVIFFESPFFV